MKKLLLSIAFVICLVNIKAQTYVTIPNVNFVNWLQANVPSAMSGNQMNITSTAVTTRTIVDIGFGTLKYNIQNITGIEYFTSLKVLNCNSQPYLILPNIFQPSLEELYVTLVSSPINSLPNNLKKLSCGPWISSLPIIPNSLEELSVRGSLSFTVIPNLPNSLKKLRISTSEPMSFSIPPNLEEFAYSGSGGTYVTIPSLPNSLKVFSINSCNAIPLPTFPNTLRSLQLTQTITFLPATLPDSLIYFDCSMSNVNSIPSLPSKLKSLNCGYTKITNLPLLPISLETLICSSSRSLSAIPDLPKGLKHFDCSESPLVTCIPPLPNSLEYVRLSDSIKCLPNYVFAMDASYYNYPICEPSDTITNPYHCPKSLGISGYTYFDANYNCEYEKKDTSLKNIRLKFKDTTIMITEFLYSGFNGSYNLIESAGSYNISIDTINKPYKEYCHLSNDTSIVLTTLQPNADSVNFSIICKSGFDVGVQSVITSGWVFPGQTHHLKINAGDVAKWYGLNCASGIAGQVFVNVSGAVQYTYSAVGALIPLASGNTFTYNIADFGTINNDTDFNLAFITDTTANVGDTICIDISITPALGDINPLNNIYRFCYPVTNSHDPNKKEVYPVDVSPNYNDWFTYTVHFQNTGSAPAINIRLKDTLDANLDINTFEVINYSHQNTWQMYNKGLVFNFPNIQLPDSSTNTEDSKGFVQYRIKPKAGMLNGSQIKNTAYIYFDYNAPIITNTTINHFILPFSLPESFINKMVNIYPNPTTGRFSIQLSSSDEHNLEVIDMTGKIVLQEIIENGNALIESNSLSNGIYIIKVSNNSGSENKKLVILK